MAKTFLDLQNLRASKIETTASKILDVDLARFYNETISDMSQYGQKLKKVTTNIVANQADYTVTVLPGIIATALVKINGYEAPFIPIEEYQYMTDKNTYCHTMVNGALTILPTPTTAETNGLVAWYWSKLPEIADAAVAGTALTDLDDKDWNVVVLGVTLKMFEKMIAISAISLESIPDGHIDMITKAAAYFEKRYNTALDNYGNQTRYFTKDTSTLGPTSQENYFANTPGRQNK